MTPRPSGLVAGAQAGSVVSMEIFIEKDQVTPVRIFPELRSASIYGAAPVLVLEEDPGKSLLDFLSHFEKRHLVA